MYIQYELKWMASKKKLKYDIDKSKIENKKVKS